MSVDRAAAEVFREMIVRVDGEVVTADALWWPSMNFNQFRWNHPLGEYELELPRAEFVERLFPAYQRCLVELRSDDLIVPDQQFPLRNARYPPIEVLPDHPVALVEAVQVYLWEDLFTAFLPCSPRAGGFMVNSIDTVTASPSVIVVRGRGYHMGSGPTTEAKPDAPTDNGV